MLIAVYSLTDGTNRSIYPSMLSLRRRCLFVLSACLAASCLNFVGSRWQAPSIAVDYTGSLQSSIVSSPSCHLHSTSVECTLDVFKAI